jgi:hypothetical protein
LSVATVGLALSWACVQSGLQAVVQETRLSVATVVLVIESGKWRLARTECRETGAEWREVPYQAAVSEAAVCEVAVREVLI